MLGWIVGKIKWLFLIAMFGGPFLAYTSWQDAEHIKTVAENGVAGEALVKGATKTTRRRGGTSYSLELAWKDAQGKVRTADKVHISNTLARKIIVDDKITVGKLPIKYLPDDADGKPVVTSDIGNQQDTDDFMVKAGAAAGGVGLLGSIAMFLFGRRRREETAEA